MLKKSYTKTKRSCRVTFKVPAELAAGQAAVLGDWNDWDVSSHPMKKRKDGSHSVTVSLEAGRDYRFRYLLDESSWTNDEAPDQLVVNRFGGHDCLITV